MARMRDWVGLAPLPIIGSILLKLDPLSSTAKSRNVVPPAVSSAWAWAPDGANAVASPPARNRRRPGSFCLDSGERLGFNPNPLNSGLNYQPVITGLDVTRGAPIELSIVHIDVEIGQKSAPGPNSRNPFERQIEMGVGRMRTISHGIDDQDRCSAHQREGFLRQPHDVVDVEDVAEAEAKRRRDAVVEGDRRDR